MKKSLFLQLKRVGICLCCWILVAGLFPMQTSAEETEEDEVIIDPQALGSITVVKYEGTDAETSPEGDTSRKRLDDVEYCLYRIADIQQIREDETGKIRLNYESLLKNAAGETLPLPAASSTVQTLSDWVRERMTTQDTTLAIANLSSLDVWRGKTGTQGISGLYSFRDLPVGIYMLYEESGPSLALQSHQQYAVVTLPTTENSEWNYDLTIYPKATVQTISMEKHIVVDTGEATEQESEEGDNDPTNDVLSDCEDYMLGETIFYQIRADVPENIGAMRCYYLKDRMSDGQDLVTVSAGTAIVQVWGLDVNTGKIKKIPKEESGITNWSISALSESANESNAEDDLYGNPTAIQSMKMRTFRIYFNTQTLSAAQTGQNARIRKYSRIYVTYEAKLNTSANIGTTGNENDAALVFSHETSAADIPNQVNLPGSSEVLDTVNPQCIDTRVYTYGISIHKSGENMTGTELAQVEFELQDAKGNPISLSKDTQGYYVDLSRANGGVAIQVDDAGEAFIRGLESGTYRIVETKTAQGYQLLKDPVFVTIGARGTDEAFRYEEAEDGAYIQVETGKGYYIEDDYGDGHVTKYRIRTDNFSVGDYFAVLPGQKVYSYTLEGDDGTMNNGAAEVTLRYAYRWTDSERLTILSNTTQEEDGTSNVWIYNQKRFEVPSTGGMGIYLYLGGGGALLVAALVLIKRRKVHA